MILAGAAISLHAADFGPRRVLVLTSFGSRFAPFDTYGSALRSGILEGWPGPVEFLETPLEIARFASSQPEEEPFAAYLRALVATRRLDLVVTIGAPAAEFVSRQRPFPGVPTLIAGLESRQTRGLAIEPNDLVVAAVFDPPGVLEDVLRLFPETKTMAVVLGASPLERFWHGELEREFAPFSGRLAFEWLDGMSLEQMLARVARLGPEAVILYGSLKIDAAGMPHEEDEGLAALRSIASRPIFGPFEEELGHGIVGGPLISIAHEAHRAAGVALRMLKGDPLKDVAVPSPPPRVSVYDWRELARFRVPESRLPPGSEIRFRPPSLWQAYRRPVLFGLALLALQSLLIAGLLTQRARLRRAEEQVHALNRRLLTAQEDERKAIARELHDDFSQRLARLAIDASRLEYAAAVPLDGQRHSPMRDELARLSEDAHALAYQLHPSALDDLGLAEALRTECERFSRLESVPVALEVDGALPEPSRETSLCLFRIAQEGLRNVARHARAKTVSLSCRPGDGGVELILRDDGAGFAPVRRIGRPSLGLASMRERVEVLGGRFRVESAPGRGTTLFVWTPLEAKAS